MPGGETSRLVSFVDFGPTLLSLCGVKPPENMQGQPFLGKYATEPRKYLFGYRGRMDERVDVVRSVTDGRYVYVLNAMPEKPQGQFLAYMYKQAGVQAWRAAFEKGNLPPEQAAFFLPKPVEALFDLETDRDEVKNLVEKPAAQGHRLRLMAALISHFADTRDLGLIPECEMLRMAENGPPADLGRNELDPKVQTAAIGVIAEDSWRVLPEHLKDPAPVVRYWAIVGLMSKHKDRIPAVRDQLTALLSDDTPCVRIAAAEALGRFGSDKDRAAALPVLIELSDPKKQGVATAILALNSIDLLSPLPADVVAKLKANSELPADTPQRMREYVPRLIERVTERAK
jgi:uncharacterized sulfatase